MLDGLLRRGASIALVFVNCVPAIGKCLCVGFSTRPPPNLPRGRLVRVHQFGTELLRQGRLSPRRRGRAGAPFCPHPLCPPLPQGGRGGTRCRAHCRAPLHPSPTQWERGWG
jgi:hypothetical protein